MERTAQAVPSVAEIGDQVRAALRSVLGPGADNVGPDTPLAEAMDQGYDSLTAMECISQIEHQFDLEVDFVQHDVRHWFATPARITTFVRDQLEDRAALGSTG